MFCLIINFKFASLNKTGQMSLCEIYQFYILNHFMTKSIQKVFRWVEANKLAKNFVF